MKKRQSSEDGILTRACNIMKAANDVDNHDTFGQNVANNLRRISTEQ